MPSPLSPLMAAARERALATGGALYRWPGGYWTTTPCPAGTLIGHPPGWYADRHTVMGMVKRGIFEITERKRNIAGEFAVTVTLVEFLIAGADEPGARRGENDVTITLTLPQFAWGMLLGAIASRIKHYEKRRDPDFTPEPGRVDVNITRIAAMTHAADTIRKGLEP